MFFTVKEVKHHVLHEFLHVLVAVVGSVRNWSLGFAAEAAIG